MKISIIFIVLQWLLVPFALADARTVTLDIPKMDCPLCPITVEASLGKVDGVLAVNADLESRSAVVEFDDSLATVDDLTAATANAGYPSTLKK